MFAENYWAHNSPSGKSPWVWFKEAGYSYVYAGENLAKDFGDTSRMMSAWMASPTHKDNIVNPKYTEIGLAVVPGTIQSQETVLVVQLFGASQGGAVPQVASAAIAPAPVAIAQVQTTSVPSPTQPLLIESESSREMSPDAKQSGRPRYNQFNLTRALNLGTTALFILALVLDLLIAESRVLTRRVGNNWAHIIFINFILLATTIVNAGKIL